MLVKDVMQAPVTTATPDLSVPKVLRLLQGRGVRHVPVVEGDALVGIISDRDVKQAMVSAAATAEGRARDEIVAHLTAGQIMTRPARSIGPDFAVEDAVKMMVSGRISAVPVTDAGRLVGIVTETDVLSLFARALGVLEPSSRLDVVVREGMDEGLGGVVRAVEGAGARISSVMTFGAGEGGRELVLRIGTIDPRPAVKALTASGYQVKNGVRGRIG
ncbi:MAG TPA: CBS and ACT domain-containing protein [Methylomirabilota bacterium]|nr:CBS and ACT domain-containing protein [Methylomirabilota bacterium]